MYIKRIVRALIKRLYFTYEELKPGLIIAAGGAAVCLYFTYEELKRLFNF